MACKALNVQRYNSEYLKQFDYVVINVLFGWYTVDYIDEYLAFLKEAGVEKVIVLGDYLVLKTEMYELINRYGLNAAIVIANVRNGQGVDKKLRRVVEGRGYFFGSKREVFCNDGCDVFDIEKEPFTYDLHHLSYDFSRKIVTGAQNGFDEFLGERIVNAGKDYKLPKHFIVAKWGPQSTFIDVVPNVQSDGSMGMWIELPSAVEYGAFEVLFGGKPAQGTYVSKNLVTASIAAKELNIPGEIDVRIKQLSTGIVKKVGVFHLRPATGRDNVVED